MSKDNPCYHCPDRYTACSDHCRKDAFLKWKQAQKARKEAERREKDVWAYTAAQIQKNRRGRS